MRAAVATSIAIPLLIEDGPAFAGTRTRRIICKRAWGGKPTKDGLKGHTVKRLTVHHSGVKLGQNREAPQRFRSEQSYHQSQGWPDIAYHVLVDRNGNIYKGRPSWAEGDSFTDYDLTGHFLVMCEGNFSEQPIKEAQLKALRDVLAWACTRFDVAPRTIKGHQDYASTACPGEDLNAMIQSGRLRRMVKKRLGNGGINVKKLCGDAGKRRVGEIENGG